MRELTAVLMPHTQYVSAAKRERLFTFEHFVSVQFREGANNGELVLHFAVEDPYS